MLGEVSAKTHHTFSKTSKEILLQTYRIWTEWLFGLEEICVATPDSEFSEDALIEAVDLARLKNKELKDLFQSNSDDFDPKFTEVWVELQEFRRPYSRFELARALRGRRLSSAYTEVTLWLITYMNHLMFNLHEIDYLLYHERGATFKPFVYIDNADTSFFISGNFSICTRLKLYRDKGLLPQNAELHVKQASDDAYENNARGETINCMLLELKTNGFNYTLT